MKPTCEPIRDLLPAYDEGELDPTEAERVSDHLRGCAACREELGFHRALPAAYQRTASAPPPDLRERVWAAWQEDQRRRVTLAVVWTGLMLRVLRAAARSPVPHRMAGEATGARRLGSPRLLSESGACR